MDNPLSTAERVSIETVVVSKADFLKDPRAVFATAEIKNVVVLSSSGSPMMKLYSQQDDLTFL